MQTKHHFNTTLDYYIGIDENETTEFKNYTLPLDNERIFALQKTVSAFLNTKGGTIFIGVNNSGIIKGAWLNKEEHNDIQAYLIDLLRDIEPSCKGFVTIDIINLETNLSKNVKDKLPHLIMLKVDKGNDNYIYNVSKYSGAYIRVAASNAYLDKSSYEDRVINNFLKNNPLLKTVYGLSKTEDSYLLMQHIVNFKSQKTVTKEETCQINSELSRADSNADIPENKTDLCACMERKKKKGGRLCYKCYRNNSEKKADKCNHPDRKIYANGLCKSCYDTNLIKNKI